MLNRNESVERAVDAVLSSVDDFIADARNVEIPEQEYLEACDKMLDEGSASVRTAVLMLMFYRLEEPDWAMHEVPVGLRGKYGDKRLCEELSNRHVTLHNAIVSPFENLGVKGGVRSFNFLNDQRFGGFFKSVSGADTDQQRKIANYLAYRFAESRTISNPLPPVGEDVLTFARARVLCRNLLALPSSGHVQQFLIAALLSEFREKQGIEVTTHHPHASDKSDRAAGDIEEKLGGKLHRAYEVTVRDDWKNRLSTFRRRMDNFELRKYIIVASGINADAEWGEPTKAALLLEKSGRDIAVLDINDMVNFLAAELSAVELRNAVNKAYEYLLNPRLSGVQSYSEGYRKIVRDWLRD